MDSSKAMKGWTTVSDPVDQKKVADLLVSTPLEIRLLVIYDGFKSPAIFIGERQLDPSPGLIIGHTDRLIDVARAVCLCVEASTPSEYWTALQPIRRDNPVLQLSSNILSDWYASACARRGKMYSCDLFGKPRSSTHAEILDVCVCFLIATWWAACPDKAADDFKGATNIEYFEDDIDSGWESLRVLQQILVGEKGLGLRRKQAIAATLMQERDLAIAALREKGIAGSVAHFSTEPLRELELICLQAVRELLSASKIATGESVVHQSGYKLNTIKKVLPTLVKRGLLTSSRKDGYQLTERGKQASEAEVV